MEKLEPRVGGKSHWNNRRRGCLCPAAGPRDWQSLWPARPPHFTQGDGLKQRGDALVLPGGVSCEVVTHSSPLGLSF